MGNAEYMGVLVPRLPERHSPLLVDSYTHEFKQQHKMPNKGSKKAKKSGSNIFSLFSQKQIQEFKEAFGIIDNDKDGIITAPDLKRPLRELDGQSAMARPTTWLERPQDQSTSPRWSHSSLRRCPEVPMTMTSSLGHLKPSKSTDRLTPRVYYSNQSRVSVH